MIDDLVPFNNHDTMDTSFDLSTVQKPRLVQDPEDKEFINKYTYYLRKMDAAVKSLFEGNIGILDESGREFILPVIMGTVQKAVDAIFGSASTRSENNTGQTKRVLLPVCCVFPGSTNIEADRFIYPEARIYEGYGEDIVGADTMYGRSAGVPIVRKYEISFLTRDMEHMNMILCQVLGIFQQCIDMHIGGDYFQSCLKFENTTDNFTRPEEADSGIRLYKCTANANMSAWLPLPVLKVKTILRQRTQTVAATDPEHLTRDTTDVVSRTLLDKNGIRSW